MKEIMGTSRLSPLNIMTEPSFLVNRNPIPLAIIIEQTFFKSEPEKLIFLLAFVDSKWNPFCWVFKVPGY